MPPQYLFPCPNCEHVFRLVPRQSGQVLDCPECQQATEAPKLGSMKQLALVEGTEAKPTSSSSGSWKNSVFVAGLLAAVICGAAGYGLYAYANHLHFDYSFEDDMENFEQGVDNLTSFQTVLLYQELNVEEGLGDWYEPNVVRYNRQSEIIRPIGYGLMGVGGLGLLALIGSFFMKP